MRQRDLCQLSALLLILLAASLTLGCGQISKPSIHKQLNWQAEDYFADPLVVRLCKAIEANDLEEMDRLIEDGADVNAKGKGNMTPLLWAFPDNKIERFKLLLEHGADPNVIIQSDFNTRNHAFAPGDSVTHIAARSPFLEQFHYVMEYGGDPNLVNPRTKESLLVMLIRSGRTKKRLKLLIEKGVDVNQRDPSGIPVVIGAVAWFGQFDVALELLDAGADPKAYMENQNSKLVHHVLREKTGIHRLSPKQQADFAKLEQRLKDMGESFEEAEADRKRWASWMPDKIGELRRAEIAARKAKEQAEEARAKPE